MRLLKDCKKMALMLVVLVLVGTAAPVHATTQTFNFTIRAGGGDSTGLAKKSDNENTAYITTTSVTGNRGEVYGAVYNSDAWQVSIDVPLRQGHRAKSGYYQAYSAGRDYMMIGQDSEYNLTGTTYVKGRWTP